jgi:hypothetical protein
MLKLSIGDVDYQVEFRHIKKDGKRAQLHERAPIRAVTVCTVLGEDFIATDVAICADVDQFSRARGRDLSFNRVVKHCSRLREAKDELFAAYMDATHRAPRPEKSRMDDDSKVALRELGHAVREQRKQLRALIEGPTAESGGVDDSAAVIQPCSTK